MSAEPWDQEPPPPEAEPVGRPMAAASNVLERLMNLEAEQALLGALMTNNKALDRVLDIVRTEHFADPVHGRIYVAICDLVDKGSQANPITLKGRFDQDDALKGLGGAGYLIKLAANVITVINAPDYAREIRECFMRRQLVDVGYTLVNDALDRSIADVDAIIDSTHAELDAASAGSDPDAGLVPAEVGAANALGAIEDAYRRGGDLIGQTTGLVDLDSACGGLVDGDLVLLAARPSMGKTALGRTIAWNAARNGGRPVFFSLEMTEVQQYLALYSSITGIDLQRLRLGRIGKDEWDKLEAAKQQVGATGLMIDDRPAAKISQMRSAIRRLGTAKRPTLIVVDYLGLMRPDRDHNRKVDEISEISAGLKAMAKDFNVPVVALAQLNRALEAREDKRPLLSDLRDSGSLEQDADAVMFIYREEYYLERAEPKHRPDETDEKFQQRLDRWEDRLNQVRGVAEILIPKNRMGPTGTCRLHFDGPTVRFSNLAQHEMAV